ncbi:MAG TPA: SUMF1/EgtB/PvdO family nonheme iron enzyme, partial [Blastocatellia bacterium]|nr:SUMF1/EgtB/PvdO family nonheme iron enzyme [Blastocatellia bacterium]
MTTLQEANPIKWLERMQKAYKAVSFVQRLRESALDEINREAQVSPFDLARYYVRPDCQTIIPVDAASGGVYIASADSTNRLPKQPVFAEVDRFLGETVTAGLPGKNTLIVLADAGMGKTALLAMLKFGWIKSFGFFRPGGKKFILRKLGLETLEQVKQIQHQYKTVLLLDSLDEDPLAYGRVKERLLDVLKATKAFHRVILTCRTQFFPEKVESRGRVGIDGFSCRAAYLSFFDLEQVQTFLEKRFPNRFWYSPKRRTGQERQRREAQRLVEKMGSLRCRPLLLAFIDELMPRYMGAAGDLGDDRAEFGYDTEYEIYESLVLSWLSYQETKQPEEERTPLFKEKLLRACELLATELTSRQRQATSEKELNLLVAQMPDLGTIKDVDVKGRSLLNLDSEGAYRFAHSSIREFLVARRLLTGGSLPANMTIPSSDLLLRFLFQGGARLAQEELLLRMAALDLRGARLEGQDLSKANLAGANLEGARLRGATLIAANLQHANLSKADLSGADLTKSNLSGADLTRADLTGTLVFGADFAGAKLDPDQGKGLLTEFETVTLPEDGGEAVERRKAWAWVFTEDIWEGMGLDMVAIPGGIFTMGSKEEGSGGLERPQHEVTVSPFQIGKYPVTQSQWRVVAGWPAVERDLAAEPSYFKGDELPVEQVSWDDAVEFCARLARQTGKDYRLPTEAEWEYACRAGTAGSFSFGETISPEFVNYNGKSQTAVLWFNHSYSEAAEEEYCGKTTPVGALGVANGFGLYDMHGNVWEWCWDWFGPYKPEPMAN